MTAQYGFKIESPFAQHGMNLFDSTDTNSMAGGQMSELARQFDPRYMAKSQALNQGKGVNVGSMAGVFGGAQGLGQGAFVNQSMSDALANARNSLDVSNRNEIYGNGMLSDLMNNQLTYNNPNVKIQQAQQVMQFLPKMMGMMGGGLGFNY